MNRTIFIFLIALGTTRACTVPVFRYALERWSSDVYQVFIFAKGENKSEAFKLLVENAVGKDSLSNYSITVIDVNTDDGTRAAEAIEITVFPWLAVYFPATAQVHGLVWDAPLSTTNAERLIHSPVRQKVAEKILSGDAAVWIFLKSGNKAKDTAALDVLKKTLAKASAELKVPNTGVDLNGNAVEVTDFVDYDVNFDFIEFSRDDPKETMLLALLLGSESDLMYFDEPMAFPVFGRGRTLYAIIGKGINETTVYNACRSIIAWCSCEVKEQHPGIDLLVSADWSNPVGGKMVKDEELPPLTGFSEFVPAETEEPETNIVQVAVKEMVSIDSARVEPVVKDTLMLEPLPEMQQVANSLMRNLLLVGGFLLIVLIASTFILKSKVNKN